ncbi:acid protease [Xylariomycetidae sp. FL2044]|nr:acid protease [Xylariomycetidae sp. FL2044]
MHKFIMSCQDFEPLAFPIADVQILSGNPKSFTKGILAGVGSPRRDIVFLPWPELNNTWIYDEQPFCDPSIIFNDVICRVRRGNLYSEGNSSSYQKADDIPSAGGASIETQSNGSEVGISKLMASSVAVRDSLDLGSTSISDAFAFGVPRLSWDHGYTISHALGLGKNSTILNSLVQAGRIGSRAWSIYWGRMWVDDELDGGVVLGGYDQQKVIGTNYTQPLDFSEKTGCWTGMKVHISSVKLNIRTGEDTELLPQNTAVDACLVPQRQLLFEGPQSILDAFEKETGMSNIGRSFGLHWSSYLYDGGNYFDGDLTISLSSGLDVRISNNQFLVPFVDVDRSGSRVFNTSRREFLYNTVYENPSTLGRYFLTGAYLMVDHDAETFTLWAANPTTESQLTPVISANAKENCAGSSQSGTSPDASMRPAQQHTSAALSGGAIAGIVIGAVAALAVLGVAIYLFLRRRRRSRQLEQTCNYAPMPRPASPKDVDPAVQQVDYRYHGPHELYGGVSEAELDGQAPPPRPVVYEM